MSKLPLFRRPPHPLIEVRILRTSHCPLCIKAVEVLRRHERRLGLRLRIEDIDDRPELLGEYRNEVPVVFVAGKKRFIGRVDPVLLEREVEGERARLGS